MENNVQNEPEPKNKKQLFEELLEDINKEMNVNMKLKDILEPVVADFSKSKAADLKEKTVNTIKDLFIEAESLQAEERAAFHQLFGVEGD